MVILQKKYKGAIKYSKYPLATGDARRSRRGGGDRLGLLPLRTTGETLLRRTGDRLLPRGGGLVIKENKTEQPSNNQLIHQNPKMQ